MRSLYQGNTREIGFMIVTKFLGPTNTRGPRIKVTLPGGKSFIVPYDSEFEPSENHVAAAEGIYRNHVRLVDIKVTYSLTDTGSVCIIRSKK